MPAPKRVELVERIASLVGPEMQIEDFGDGWPAFVGIELDKQIVHLALYVGGVHQTGRGNSAERRIQNPSSERPIERHLGRLTVLLGLWEPGEESAFANPVLVLPEADRRVGRGTRWSMFVRTATLEDARINGWPTQVTTVGENLACFHPQLLPLAIASLICDVHPDKREVRRIIRTAEGSARRRWSTDRGESLLGIRRAVSVLVRDTLFSGDVLDAYNRRCAMCGLGLNLVQGAHIYPASAPGSTDVVSNGIALCANHHLAFDRHEIAVVPPDMDVIFRPDILERAEEDSVARAFVESTYLTLGAPYRNSQPDPQMLYLRYEYFAGEYDWLASRLR